MEKMSMSSKAKNIAGKFEKVSFEQFAKDCKINSINLTEKELKEAYDNIKLPVRGTSRSAGYDFFLPTALELNEEWKVIPTGIKCKIHNNWFLAMMPKSGLGYKFRYKFANTIGIIDADYYNCRDNEGHIMLKLNSEVATTLPAGKSFVQAIFLPFGVTEEEGEIVQERVGGFGSTSK